MRFSLRVFCVRCYWYGATVQVIRFLDRVRDRRSVRGARILHHNRVGIKGDEMKILVITNEPNESRRRTKHLDDDITTLAVPDIDLFTRGAEYDFCVFKNGVVLPRAEEIILRQRCGRLIALGMPCRDLVNVHTTFVEKNNQEKPQEF